jgi:ribonuclease J
LENTFVLENGDVLEMTKDKGQKAGRIKSGIILIDSSRAWQINDSIVAERRHLSEDGLVIVAVTIDANRKIVVGPDVSLKGVILPRGLPIEDFIVIVQNEAKAFLSNRSVVEKLQMRDLQSYLLGSLNRFFAEKMRAKPLVQILLNCLADGANGAVQYSPPDQDKKLLESKGRPSPASKLTRGPNDIVSS